MVKVSTVVSTLTERGYKKSRLQPDAVSLTRAGDDVDPRLSAESLQEGVVPLQSEGGVLDDGAAARVLEPLHAPEHGGLARGVVQHDVALVAERGEGLVSLSLRCCTE